MLEDGTAQIDATAVDPEGLEVSYTNTQPAHGALSGTGPLFVYTPEANYAGTDSFTVTVSDGEERAAIPVTITITAVNDAPLATGRQVVTQEDEPLPITLSGVDVDNPTLSFTVMTTPAHGTLSGTPPAMTYTPELNYYGPDSFSFLASDGAASSGLATITINVDNVIACGDAIREGDEGCDDGNENDADACRNSCVSATCGDGVTQADVEQCDDGNQNDADACRNSCVSAICGDGVVQADVEQCDDANGDDTDACRNSCAVATCGDGVTQADVEACDDGNRDDADACRNSCAVATCGDGVVRDGVEACDDGNADDTDACRNSCAVATCGDGVIQANVEACDDANSNNLDGCLNSCAVASCGDGFIRDNVEQCDDANGSNLDGCLNSCTTAACGDGFTRDGVEQCDDANLDNADSCLSTCTAASCGDGFLRDGVEACDDGNLDNADSCLNSCSVASCGDGFTYFGFEQCDDANGDNGDDCLNSCATASCGDGFVWSGVEQCDDTNLSNGDGCLNSCVFAVCGDGFVESGVEGCDDGNQDDNDFCHNDCTAPVCGDGEVNPGEECDDGGSADNDGCGHSCLVERCGDGLIQLPAGESCDDGNLGNGDGCDAACHVEPFATTPPVLISGGQSCTTSVANAARKIAVDGSGTLYAVMQCDIRALAVASTNRGNSFSSPYDLSTSLGTPDNPAVVSQVAVGNGPSGVAYAAIMLNTGEVFLRITNDRGATWSPGVQIGQSVNTSSGLSLQSFNDNVYVGFATSGGVAVARNATRGVGTFDITPVGMSIAFFDVLYDITLGTLAVVADTPGFHVRVSTDGGVSFDSERNPPGQEYYSDWAIGNGRIFVSGTNLGSLGDSNSIYVIPSANPTSSTRVFGLPAMSTAQSRTLAADSAGNVFAGTQLDGGGIQLDRLAAGTTTFNTPRLLSVAGNSPIVSGLPGNSGAAVVYTISGNVYVTIQVYP